MSKIFYCDVETTGLDCQKHDIIQLSYIIEINKEVVEEGNYLIQPFNYNSIDPKALEVSKTTIEDLHTYENPKTVYSSLNKVLEKYVNRYKKEDKFSPAGYNVNFDIGFLKQFFYKNDDRYYGAIFDYHILDPITFLYMLEYKGLIKLENYKLETVCKYFGIPLEAHKALSDIRATKRVIEECLEYLK